MRHRFTVTQRDVLKSSSKAVFSAGFNQSESGPKAVGMWEQLVRSRVLSSATPKIRGIVEKISEKVYKMFIQDWEG